VTCFAQYRQAGTTNWNNALDFWFDPRSSATVSGHPRSASEYRGSIVGLKSGTSYEIKLTLSTGTTQTITATTWDDSVPIASAVYQPETNYSTISITQSGSSSGYIVYKPQPGKTATIDAGRTTVAFT
jgi:hypothetical protein